MKPVLAFDGDGVLVDFTTPALEYINASGRSKTHEQVTDWSVFDNDEVLEEAYKREVVAHPDFCRGMRAYPGAVEFVRAARQEYQVLIVTAPYDVPHWYEGRRDWMVENLGVSKKDVCFLSRKEFFDSDVFVDDKVENVVSWANRQFERRCESWKAPLPIIVDQPWNRVPLDNMLIRRASSWRGLSDLLVTHGYPPVKGDF
jgi:5'(3')-deoxyribonucleotidase